MAVYPEKREGKPTGWWYAEVRTKDARHRERFQKLDDAKRFEACVKATGTVPPWALKASKGPTFADAVKACRADGGPKGKWKRGRDNSGMKRLAYVEARFGDVLLTEFTTETFDLIAESLEDRPARAAGEGKLSGDTINRYLSAASAVLTYAAARPKTYPGVVHPEVPYRPKGSEKLVWYSPEQEAAVCRVLEATGASNVALCVRVLAATGMRIGELLKLAPGEVEDQWIRLWKTKTDRPRSVPIDPSLAMELRAMISSRSVPTYRVIYLRLKDAVGKCGYSPELGIHALRHTTATRLIRKGNNVAVVQRFLGHSNIATTMRYVHMMDDDLLKAAHTLNPTAWANAEHEENITMLPASRRGA